MIGRPLCGGLPAKRGEDLAEDIVAGYVTAFEGLGTLPAKAVVL
jgi:hypothetical protein